MPLHLPKACLLLLALVLTACHEYHPPASARFKQKLPPELEHLTRANLNDRPAFAQLASDLGYASRLPRTPAGQLTPDAQATLDQIITTLQTAVTIKSEPGDDGSTLYTVTAHHDDPRLSPLMANRLIENHMRSVRTAIENTLIAEKKLCDTQINHWRAQVSKLESANLRNIVRKPGDPDQPAPDTTDLNHAKDQLQHWETRLRAAQMNLTLSASERAAGMSILERARDPFPDTPPDDELEKILRALSNAAGQ